MMSLLIMAIYARVSTEEQAKHGYSIEFQISKCKEQIYKDNPNNEITIMEYIDSGFSGEFIERPFLIKLREDVRSGFINKIYCYDPDRLSRTLMHQLILDEELNKKSQILFVNGEYDKTPEGKLFYQFRGAIAEFEKAKINERMINGRKQKAKNGKVIKDYNIYGYDYDKEKGKLIINKEEAKTIRFIFDSFTAKDGEFKGMNGIALYLTDKEIPTKTGKSHKWHRQVVRQILMNPTYIGKFYQNKWNTEGMLVNKFKDNPEDKIRISLRSEDKWIPIECPSIIDKNQFQFAQQLLQASRQRWSGTSNHNYLLSGLLRCNKCLNTMTGRKTTNWGKVIYEYTDIKNTAGYKTKGCGLRLKCNELDTYVWEEILAWLKDDEDPNSKEENFSSYEAEEINRLTILLEEKELGRKQFIKSLIKIQGLTQEEINENLMESQTEIKKTKKQLVELNKQLGLKELSKQRRNILKDSYKLYLIEDPQKIPFEKKKELIRMTVREIRVDKELDLAKIFLFD